MFSIIHVTMSVCWRLQLYLSVCLSIPSTSSFWMHHLLVRAIACIIHVCLSVSYLVIEIEPKCNSRTKEFIYIFIFIFYFLIRLMTICRYGCFSCTKGYVTWPVTNHKSRIINHAPGREPDETSSVIPLKRAIRYFCKLFDTPRSVSNFWKTLRIALFKGITEDVSSGS